MSVGDGSVLCTVVTEGGLSSTMWGRPGVVAAGRVVNPGRSEGGQSIDVVCLGSVAASASYPPGRKRTNPMPVSKQVCRVNPGVIRY